MRYDMPRVPRDRYRTDAKVKKAVAATGCFTFLLWLAVWATVIFVIAHFVLKYW